jgi:hypothetical protein
MRHTTLHDGYLAMTRRRRLSTGYVKGRSFWFGWKKQQTQQKATRIEKKNNKKKGGGGGEAKSPSLLPFKVSKEVEYLL